MDDFVQDNLQNVLRGLHFRMRGRTFDIALDLRRGSPTFGRWYGVELSDQGPRQLYMASGFAHGFCVVSEFADHDSEDEAGLIWSDRDVGIRWPIANTTVSPRDDAYPALRQLDRARLPHVGVPS
jgi:dTDP-4-dehydrorhamnose 3,5-epimerase